MTRETRFGLFLAGVMLLSMAGAAASADPKIHTARSVERTMERNRQQLAVEQARKEKQREAAEAADRDDADAYGSFFGADGGTAETAPAGTVLSAPCKHCTR
jgi:hypothetical protein